MQNVSLGPLTTLGVGGPSRWFAEIHTEDADIVYVLDGSATLVTGGTAVNTKETAPGELRGDSIQGGETRQLAKGDVIVIPAGMPHWFKETTVPFLYYVVKAR